MTIYLILSALGGLILGMVIMALCAMASERRDASRITAALWEVVRSAPHIGTRAILEKHGIEIPEDRVVF